MLLAKKKAFSIIGVFIFILIATSFISNVKEKSDPDILVLKAAFKDPPDSARPGVYWYFMDGNMSKEGMDKDLESMKKAGIGQVLFLEVNVGVPRGKVDYLSEEWYQLFKHGVDMAKRLGIDMTLGIGPGWTGSGGPWVPAKESMQHLVASDTIVAGPAEIRIKLPVPLPKRPYFGEGGFTPELKKEWERFYQDVAVIAFPAPKIDKKIEDIDEKALYYRAPFSSVRGVKSYLPSLSNYSDVPGMDIDKSKMINLTKKLSPDGVLNWNVPSGKWIIMRFGARNNGAITRPAPVPGLGFECDKFDTAALKHHMENYVGKILTRLGPMDTKSPGGLKRLHMDSWEMGAQNWTSRFRKEFIHRRGYDPLPFYPVYAGYVVGNMEMSERFLWDLRQTCQELVFTDHVNWLKKYAYQHDLRLSIEPYDMNPTADLELGSLADIPMGEFWSKGYGFNSSFSCIEATSIAHINGQPVVQAEAFTANGSEAWKQYPGSMKNQGDWALALGINRFFYHTFEHKPWADSLQPGMTMGPYGVHWDRKQTWWPMASAYHLYITRCQFMLQQGKPVADILYLTPEGAPQVFIPPASALAGDSVLPDKKGYNFDGCSPGQLYKAKVNNHQIIFPGGAKYHLLVLPRMETMTPKLLKKIQSLIKAGAIVLGIPPKASPSLVGYPSSDKEVKNLAGKIWGGDSRPVSSPAQGYGKGKIIWGDPINASQDAMYPDYLQAAAWLHKMDIKEDFKADKTIRYHHRTSANWDIYFVSNATDSLLHTKCAFRTDLGAPELWNPLTGETRPLPEYTVSGGQTSVPLKFEPYQSFFIIFSSDNQEDIFRKKNFPLKKSLAVIKGPWQVYFKDKWSGERRVTFDKLVDWTSRKEEDIRYYSGIATYRKEFDFNAAGDTLNHKQLFLELGMVKNLAHVWLNGHDLGVVWTAPWEVNITGIVKQNGNELKIEVANLWPNRLIGDAHLPNPDNAKEGQFPDWLIHGTPRMSSRYTFTTYPYYKKDDPLLSSGLMGPIEVCQKEF